MNLHFLKDKITGEVSCWSTGKIKFDEKKFEWIEISVTKKQEEDIKQGRKKAIIKDKKLTLEDF